MSLDALKERGFQVEFLSHARAILESDFPELIGELHDALSTLTIPIEEIVGSGGGETKGTQRLRQALTDRKWAKHNFEIVKTINGVRRESVSHEVDHVRVIKGQGTVALEIEWNNKDPFFDRDLENFKRLHAEGAISVGVIVTRGESMQDEMRALVRRFAEENKLAHVDDLARIDLAPTKRQRADYTRRMGKKGKVSFAEAWSTSFVNDKYGSSTTHWRKLEDRVKRGVGNPCPLLLIGLPTELVTFGEPKAEIDALLKEGADKDAEE